MSCFVSNCACVIPLPPGAVEEITLLASMVIFVPAVKASCFLSLSLSYIQRTASTHSELAVSS